MRPLTPPVRLPRLVSFELAWTDAAFDAIHPDPSPDRRGPALPHGIRQLHPARFFDALLADVPLEQSIGLRVALWIVALAPLFTIKKLATFASLGAGDRQRVLERLLSSPIYAVRQLTTGLKAMAALLYSQSPSVRAAMLAPTEAKLVSLRRNGKGAGAVEEGGAHEHAAE